MPGGPWDHKHAISRQFGSTQEVDGNQYEMDEWSNIHYGYVGRSLGFTDDELLWGAGGAQLGDEVWKALPGTTRKVTPGYFPKLAKGDLFETYLDNSGDPRAIAFGAYLWDQYGKDLTKDIFLKELADHPELRKENQ